jgi:hypothetical protein
MSEGTLVRELLSKLVAGGLSAAVILLWWPNFVHHEGAVSWLVRGVVWTLSFELLLHALLPLERALWESAAARRVRDRTNRLPAPRRVGARAALACGALAVPAALLATAPAPPPEEKPAQVRHVTQVKRIVRVEATPGPNAPLRPSEAAVAPESAPAAPATVAAPERVLARPTPRRQPARQAPSRTTAPSQGGKAPPTTGTGTSAPTSDESPQPQPRSSTTERAGGVA